MLSTDEYAQITRVLEEDEHEQVRDFINNYSLNIQNPHSV